MLDGLKKQAADSKKVVGRYRTVILTVNGLLSKIAMPRDQYVNVSVGCFGFAITSFVNKARPVRACEAQRRTISGWLLLSLMWPRISVEVLVSIRISSYQRASFRPNVIGSA